MDFLRENSLNNIVPHKNVRASLRIMGEHFDIHKVTEVLEMHPNEVWNKGELIRNTKKNVHIQHGYITRNFRSLSILIRRQGKLWRFSRKKQIKSIY